MSKMNLPNKLTLIRLCMVPVIIAFLLLPASVIHPYICYAIAAVIFVATAVTDVMDGHIARSNGLVTNFGKFMDPVADKLMVIGTMLSIFFRMLNPSVYGVEYNFYFTAIFFAVIVLVIFREFAITSLRLVLVNSSGKVVAANILGKLKTLSQVVCIGALLVEPLLDALITYFIPDYFLHGIYPVSIVFMCVVMVMTVWSGYNYLKGGWKYISTDK